MEERNAVHLRLVENDEVQTPDQFAPVGTAEVLAAAFRIMMEKLKSLENAHRRIRLDNDYVTRKSELMAVGEQAGEQAAEKAHAGEWLYAEFEDAFYWLHAAVSGYFDQAAEIYTGPANSARNAQGSVNTYLPNTFESLLKNTFAVARVKYLQQAISAAAALVILGILPAGIRQVQEEYRDHVRKKVLRIIQELGEAHAFRYIPERQIFQLLGMPRDKFEEQLRLQSASPDHQERHSKGRATIGRSADQSIPLAIFAIRSQVGIPDFDVAARITNLTALEVVK